MEELKKVFSLKKVDNAKDFENGSKDILKDAMEKLIKTTMVGAIKIIEDELANLLENGDDFSIKLEQKYRNIRSQIFDNGHLQIKKMKDELNNYKILMSKYSVTLPVVQEGKRNEK